MTNLLPLIIGACAVSFYFRTLIPMGMVWGVLIAMDLRGIPLGIDPRREGALVMICLFVTLVGLARR